MSRQSQQSQVSDAGLNISARWDKALVPASGGEATLLVRLSAAPRVDGEEERRRAPVDVAFILDRSGSMAGERLALAKEAVDVAVAHLRDDDRAALVVYDHVVETLHCLDRATPRTKTALRLALHGLDAGGSTDLSSGWLTGCGELSRDTSVGSDDNADGSASRIKRALLLTDGLANAGITDTAELTHHAQELRQRGIATTTLGVGLGFNEDLLGGMAEAGGGNFQFIERAEQLRAFFERELREMLTVAATGLSLGIALPAGVRARLVNAFPTSGGDGRLTVALRDLPAGDTIDLVFTVAIAANAVGTEHQLRLTVTWSDPVADTGRTVEVLPAALVLAEPETVAATLSDPDVAKEAVRQHAASAQRAAMRLDRQGRYLESRAHLQAAAGYLQTAPVSAEIAAELATAQHYASYQMSAPLPEEVRKRVTFDAHRRSRGNRAPNPEMPFES